MESGGVIISTKPNQPEPLTMGAQVKDRLEEPVAEKNQERLFDYPDPTPHPHSPPHVTISMPSTPTGLNAEAMRNGFFGGDERLSAVHGFRDKRFDSFKTWSGRLERQISGFRGRTHDVEDEDRNSPKGEHTAAPPVARYFDALHGPELDKLKPLEHSVLPEDKLWPFLLRFPISSFGICLGVSSQAILWKTLATSPPTMFLHVTQFVNFALWCTALALTLCVSTTYAMKVVFYFEAVRREYYHPVRVNFFFAPWIACLFLCIGIPPSITDKLPSELWYVLMAPIFGLELKIYGQWMSGGERRLSKVANPSNHLAIVGNFVGALLGASMGLKEGPIFFFSVGLAHYIVLFVTLYQRLPTNETLPKELHPVFFLFVAAPSVAGVAWATIHGHFDTVSRIAYFIAMFLYASLVVRINFFRGVRFSLAWWAYTFPMTGAAIATIEYSAVVKNPFTQVLSLGLSAISTVTVTALLVSTIIHAFVLGDLFPNDLSIAIAEKPPRLSKRRINLICGTPERKKVDDDDE
ncbi:S-type anion channel SLAH3-like [Wolffia australiana]